MKLVEVTSFVKACADPDDDRNLAAALDADCSLLVTGDTDFLTLKKFQGIDFVTPRQFSETINCSAAHGNVTAAAKKLGISRRTLHRKINEMNLTKKLPR